MLAGRLTRDGKAGLEYVFFVMKSSGRKAKEEVCMHASKLYVMEFGSTSLKVV
jgi:hypothetical protein